MFLLINFVLFSTFLRPKLQDSQFFSQHRKPLWWAGSVYCLPASSLLQREWCQHFISATLRHQEGVFLQHHSLLLPQQDHGQERDSEPFTLLFLFNSLFLTVLFCFSSFLTLSPLQRLFCLVMSLLPLCNGVYVCYPQDEDLEAQVSFLQGQINDLESMSKYCAKMMNTHICEYSRSQLLNSSKQ